jgi:hypothetical protein
VGRLLAAEKIFSLIGRLPVLPATNLNCDLIHIIVASAL